MRALVQSELHQEGGEMRALVQSELHPYVKNNLYYLRTLDSFLKL
jgi:hypothetical protein